MVLDELIFVFLHSMISCFVLMPWVENINVYESFGEQIALNWWNLWWKFNNKCIKTEAKLNISAGEAASLFVSPQNKLCLRRSNIILSHILSESHTKDCHVFLTVHTNRPFFFENFPFTFSSLSNFNSIHSKGKISLLNYWGHMPLFIYFNCYSSTAGSFMMIRRNILFH